MTSPMAGERIRSLRRLLGISQVELARAAGIRQPIISDVELSVRPATDELLDAIAQATGTPRSFFDVLPPDLPLGTLRFRKLATARQSDTKRVKALFDEAYRVVGDLLSTARYPLPELPVATGEVTDRDIERLALEAREALQIGGDSPVRHLTRSVERAGVAVTPLTLPGDHAAEDEAIGHFGVSHWPGPGDGALVGVFTGGSGDRQRFTVAHELAHLILHSRRRTVFDPEGEANKLAGAILLPDERARSIFADGVNLSDLVEVKRVWGISIQALIMRGGHLGMIDDRRKTSLFKQLSARGWRKNEPVNVHLEEPMLVWRLLAKRFGNPVPYQKVAAELGLSAVVLRSLAPPPSDGSPTPRGRTDPPSNVSRIPTRPRLRSV
ncbi:helix-turn-helix domain-containing protein [Micromonospora sp. NPDC005163]